MFFDEVNLELVGGRGGSGMVSFHREKFIAFGPPDGGDGGNGGSVILEVDNSLNTFRHFSGQKQFKAEKGTDGHKNNRAGRRGEDFVLKVPEGTLVYDVETGDLIVDLKENGQQFVAATGGRGGYGNSHFVSSVRQAPKFAELGDVGQERHVRLEMQLVADVGLVGFPSAGKSTLISHISSAKPKIGDYPFTTLTPNLGVVYLSDFGGSREQSFVVADIPGIIEGASEGKGLGDTFLKHISRSAILLYLLDPFAYDNREIVEQFEVLRGELEKYNPDLLKKDQFVVMNKIDAIPEEDRRELSDQFLKAFPDWEGKFRLISGVSGEGLSEFMFELWNLVQKRKAEQDEAPEVEESDEIPEYTPQYFVDEQSFEVEEMYELDVEEFGKPVNGKLISDESMPKRKLFAVKGERICQISRMTNTEQEGAIQRIYDVMFKMGIENELRRAGAKTGDYVKIEPHFFEYHESE
jgi:GTP-binding protein